MTESAVKTPDQRLHVFVSSTLEELAEEREAVRHAIERMHLYPVLFELGARPHPPRTLYRAYLQQSHIFIGIYWQSHGWVGPEMEISGLEDEFWMSVDMPRLIYIKEPAPDRQHGLSELLDRIRGEGDASYKKFRDPRQLGDLVADDIAVLLTERFSGSGGQQPVGRCHRPPSRAVDSPRRARSRGAGSLRVAFK
jgi:Domain of unknown function (DUF4062)